MNYMIKNENLTVDTRTFGGELTSIKDSAGTEYLWQGNPEYWKGQAPVLFPIVGSLRNKKAIIGGNKTCCMERHGVARKKEFSMTQHSENSVTFTLLSDEETKKRYPYDFKLETMYRLDGKNILIQHTVYNPNDTVMPFQIGGHPAFNCPLESSEKFEDYVVEFEQPETAECPLLDAEGIPQMDHRVSVLKNSKTLAMKHELFLKDALIFDHIKSRKVTLHSQKTGKGICVSFSDLNYLLIWSSANGGPFVALEPWSGIGTCSDESDIFEQKRGVYMLPAGEKKIISYQITVLN